MRLWKRLCWVVASTSLLLSCQIPSDPTGDPDKTSIRLTSPCGGYVQWNVQVQREVFRQDTVAHAYDDCQTVLVYYKPLQGEPAYPPCWGHGGTFMSDGGDRTWTCLDSSVRSFDLGPSRPYDGSSCTGLALGCAYATYSWTIPREN